MKSKNTFLRFFKKKKISNKNEIFNLFTRAIWTKLDNLDNFDISDKKGNVHKTGHCGQIWTLWTKLDNSANCTNYWDKIERLKDQTGSLLLYESKLRITTEL